MRDFNNSSTDILLRATISSMRSGNESFDQTCNRVISSSDLSRHIFMIVRYEFPSIILMHRYISETIMIS